MTKWPNITLTATLALLMAGVASAYAPRPTFHTTPTTRISVPTTVSVKHAGLDSASVSTATVAVEPCTDTTTIPGVSECPAVILVRPVGNSPFNCGNDPVNNSDPLGLFDLPTHANVTISSLRQMKGQLGLTDAQYSELLRGAVEGSMYPDLQARPVIPAGTPVATLQEVDRVMGIIGWPFEKVQDAGEWVGGRVDDAQTWAVGLVWKDYPRIHNGVINWWEHGPSFLGPILKTGADHDVAQMNALYQTHFGKLSWQHGMGDAGMNATDVEAKIVAGSLANLAAYQECGSKGNYYDAGFELGKTLHYLQDTYTPSHAERDPTTGQITAFYDYNVQSPTRHGEADKPGLDSAVFNTAVRHSQSLIGIFLKDNSGAMPGLFQVTPNADIGIPGRRFGPGENIISPLDLLRGDF